MDRDFNPTPKEERMYATYERYYAKAEARIGVLYGEKFNIHQFTRFYAAKKEQYQEQIKKGKRKKMPNITRDIVSRQEYLLTHAEIRNWARAAKEQGLKEFNTSVLKNIQSKSELDPIAHGISARYAQLRNEKFKVRVGGDKYEERPYTSEEARIIIAQEFFGSH